MKSSKTRRSVLAVKQHKQMDVRSKVESMLTKFKRWETPFGVVQKVITLLRNLPGTSTVAYPDQNAEAIRFPFDVEVDGSVAENRGVVCTQTREYVSYLTSHGVPEQPVWEALRDFDSMNRIPLKHCEGIVRSYRVILAQDQNKHNQLDEFLRQPPALHPLSAKERDFLIQLIARQRRGLNDIQRKLLEADSILSKAKKNYGSKKSPHLAKVKASLFQLIRDNTRWSRHRTANEVADLLLTWNAELAGKGTSHRTSSYLR
jgi:hypothetical protein